MHSMSNRKTMDVSPMVFFSYENFNTAIDTKKEGKYMFLFGKKGKKSTQTAALSQTAQNTQVKRAAHGQAAQAVTETEEEKAAHKQAEKEAAIAAYKEKRELTLRRFFEIAELPFP